MAELKQRRGADCPRLNVYGEGPLEGELKEMTSVLRLDSRVRFHGAVPGILDTCPATDILVVSSRIETGPLVALEAMSRGMPIVATYVGEIPEMIPDHHYGHVVKPRSIIALADGIESMMADVSAGRFDPDLLIARHRSLFTVAKMADRMDSAYKDWIAHREHSAYLLAGLGSVVGWAALRPAAPAVAAAAPTGHRVFIDGPHTVANDI